VGKEVGFGNDRGGRSRWRFPFQGGGEFGFVELEQDQIRPPAIEGVGDVQDLSLRRAMDESFALQTGGDVLAATLGFKPFGFGGDVKNQGRLLNL
jgi:hypothetical protein